MERKQKNKSKGNGEGSLYFNKAKKIWVGQYFSNGKRKAIYQKKSETATEFKKRFTKIINDINQGTYIDKIEKTFLDILKEHIQNKYDTNSVTARTYLRDMGTLQQIEKTCTQIINMPIQKITVYHIRKVLPNITVYSNNTINKIYRLISKTFKIALSDRIIPFNPMENESISKPKSCIPDKEIKALTLKEQKNY